MTRFFSRSARISRKVTETAIPFDSVFDTLSKEGKILFIHRLSSKAAAFYLKLMLELFDLEEEKTWAQVVDKRNEQLGNEARGRLVKMRLGEQKRTFFCAKKKRQDRRRTLWRKKKDLMDFQRP